MAGAKLTVTALCAGLLLMAAPGAPLPAGSYGTGSGSAATGSAAESEFAFHLPTQANHDQFELASSLHSAGRSYGSGAATPVARVASNSYTTALTTNADAIVYPDDITRDSYGNLAKPYVPLGETTASTPNKDSHNHPGQQQQQQPAAGQIGHHETKEGVKYPVPSYASGILDTGVQPPLLDLQPPPLSSGNFYYPQTPEATGSTATAQAAATIPERPVVHTDAPASTYNPNNGGFQLPATSLNEVSSPTDSKYPDEVSKPSTGGGSYSTVPQNTIATTSATTSTYTHGKFSGSFGGAPGLLGEQKIPGTAYNQAPSVSATASHQPQPQQQQQPTQQPLSQPQDQAPQSQHNPQQHAQQQPQHTPQYSQQPQNNPQYQPLPSPQQHPQQQAPPQQPAPSATTDTYTHGKFTGSFGGAPGILGVQTVPGTAVKPTATASATSQATANSDIYNHAHSQPPSNHSSVQQPSAANPIATASAATQAPVGSDFYNHAHSQPPANHPSIQQLPAANPIATASAATQASVSSDFYNHAHSQPPANHPSIQHAPEISLSPPASNPNNYPSTNTGSSYQQPASQDYPTGNVLGHQAQPGFSATTASASAAASASAGTFEFHQKPATAPSLSAILGEQKQPGYGVVGAHAAASASATAAASAGSGAVAGAAGHPNSYGSAGKFTGTFGGPPGVLSPYDKPVVVGAQATTAADSHANAYAGPKKRY